MMLLDPSMPDREVRIAPQARPRSPTAPASAAVHQDMQSGRTSRPELPASDQLANDPERSGKQRHPLCRSSHEHKHGDRTTDDTGIAPRVERSCGRSQASLYNQRRRHQGRGMNGRTPAQAFVEGMPKSQQQKEEKPTRKTSNQTSRLTPPAHSGPVSRLPSLYNPANDPELEFPTEDTNSTSWTCVLL